MPASKYRFVSPGIQFREVDQSRIPKEPQEVGPVIIGRASKGPGLRPVKINNIDEFVETFGEPQPGGTGDDVWRLGGDGLSPTYGAYAAEAWLKNSTPCTFIRLLGRESKYKDSNGNAGWRVGTGFSGGTDSENSVTVGGAYGLFLINSGSQRDAQAQGRGLPAPNVTGTLAAVWYMKDVSSGAALRLRGVNVSGTLTSSNAYFLRNAKQGPTFALEYSEGAVGSETVKKTIDFDFNEDSGNFIRKKFTTNPTKTNSTFYSDSENFFLGESFERDVRGLSLSSSAKNVWGVMLGLQSSYVGYQWCDNRSSTSPATTNWIIGQDMGASGSYNPRNVDKIFQIKTIDNGIWNQANIKISISDIRYSPEPSNPYGTFSVLVRRAQDNDNFPEIIESFSNCNLNPESPNYVASKIGDTYSRWDEDEKRYRYYGKYPNNSKYVYVEMADDVDLGASNPSLLPFGFYGPLRFSGFTMLSGSRNFKTLGTTTQNKNVGVVGLDTVAGVDNGVAKHNGKISQMPNRMTASFEFPKTALRADSTLGSFSDRRNAYWGLDTTKFGGSVRHSRAYVDVVRGLSDIFRDNENGPTISESGSTTSTPTTEYQYIFTLDDISYHSSSTSKITDLSSSVNAYYISGSRKTGTSLSATSSVGTGSYKNTLDEGINRFTIPLHGGFDGVDITQPEPFNNYAMTDVSYTINQYSSYEYNSILNAIDSVADPESAEFNILSAPGITNTGLTDRILDVCENRGDSLGVIDVEGGFLPKADRSSATLRDYDTSVRGSVKDVVRNIKSRQINNSYGAAYYPWVQIRDSSTGRSFYGPPSIPAIGTYSFSQEASEVWFAPAGFVRGGLSNGAAGIPVVGVTERLSSRERDELYENNINPIATFPAEGIVIFGQKTLQTTRSALDRVNVRRLLIHLKKEISRISSTILFDPNLSVTWDRFKGQVNPFLESVKARLGLEDYKVVLDNTTTTPDLVDRNIMYAKIFIKPARAIEFIAIDFVITRSGASFED